MSLKEKYGKQGCFLKMNMANKRHSLPFKTQRIVKLSWEKQRL